MTQYSIRGDARCFASPRTFRSYGQSGMQFSDYLPHLATRADDLCMVRSMYTTSSDHDPGQLLMQCRTVLFGHPCMGSWVTYGLGSELQNLPGFVVLLLNSMLPSRASAVDALHEATDNLPLPMSSDHRCPVASLPCIHQWIQEIYSIIRQPAKSIPSPPAGRCTNTHGVIVRMLSILSFGCLAACKRIPRSRPSKLRDSGPEDRHIL